GQNRLVLGGSLHWIFQQYLKNAGSDGAKRDGIYEYIKDVMPSNKTEEQKLRSLGDLLKVMKTEELIRTDGRNWFIL
ncbi:AAA family ATPase, partial [Parabacteroides johnsonii]|nr:AAA family ATPase [Parabacteroides johnsonii]